MEVKHLFFTALEAKKWRWKEVTGVTERVIGHRIGRDWHVRSVQPAGARGEVRGFVTGASDHSRDRHVWSCTQESSAEERIDWMRWCVRSVTIGRVRSTKSLSGPLLDSNRTPGVTRPVNSSVASGHALTKKVTFHDRWRLNEWNLKRDTWRASAKSRRCDQTLWPRPVDLTCAFGQCAQSSFFVPNGSILWSGL
jgi:hypothetical protein